MTRVLKVMPETKGVPLEEMAATLELPVRLRALPAGDRASCSIVVGAVPRPDGRMTTSAKPW